MSSSSSDFGTLEKSVLALSAKQIRDFFSKNTGATQEECNQLAQQIIGQPVHPTPVQGVTSYTITAANDAGDSVVQFRNGDNALDIALFACIERVYSSFMPHHQYYGTLGALHVYRIAFFAEAWHNRSAWANRPASMPRTDSNVLHADYLSKLKQLSEGLPKRFSPTVDYLISELPRLFDGHWPLVPHHKDLIENNIHVDPATGSVTGICDWMDTTDGPFGTTIWSLDAILGTRSGSGRRQYYPNHDNLRDLFWAEFRSAIGPSTASEEFMAVVDVARQVGLFLDNGFVYTSETTWSPVAEGSYELNYLESMSLGLLSSSIRS
ncbi:hypothetical protein BHE90_015665 [Fusarium euwallaceae]|uniref:Aminoglycoside phosphotransferase domain-containing protein n=1 Tax=Fusarium euwallaceae TaxID=1147111 RepID=A0A430L2L0_9HYPO|nr:hypothetical protein BHE90_015665 [Fusarium euwallaceae]